MVYRDPLTRELVFDDFSYCILAPLGGSLYIISLVKSGKLSKPKIIRTITELKEALTLKEFIKQIAKRPGLVIISLEFLDRIFFSKYNVVSKEPKLCIVGTYAMYIFQNMIHRQSPNSWKDYRSILIRSFIQLGAKFGVTFVVMGLEFIIFQTVFGRSIANCFVDFSYFKWCYNNPLKKMCLTGLSCLIGTAIGCKVSSKRSKALAQTSFGIWLFTNIAKSIILQDYTYIISELRTRGYSWEEIYEQLKHIIPSYYQSLLSGMAEREKAVARFKIQEILRTTFLLDSPIENSFSGNPINSEAQRDIEHLCSLNRISDKTLLTYVPSTEVIVEPEVTVETDGSTACTSNLFRSNQQVN